MTHLLPEHDLLTVAELSAAWRVPERTIYRWIDKGALRVVRIQTRVRVLRTEAVGFMREAECIAAEQHGKGAA